MSNQYTKEGKANKIQYIQKYNKAHYRSINVCFKTDDLEDRAIHKFLQSQKSTNKYIKELVKKEMERLGLPVTDKKEPIVLTDKEIEELTVEQMDGYIDMYVEMFDEMPIVIYPTSVYSPMYMKLIVKSLNRGRPYTVDEFEHDLDPEDLI